MHFAIFVATNYHILLNLFEICPYVNNLKTVIFLLRRQPVDRLEHPDYDKIIDTPMDLSIIREDLKCDNYETPHEFYKDLKIMFNNAKNYTPNKRSRVRISGKIIFILDSI